jgi:hypothetical protein
MKRTYLFGTVFAAALGVSVAAQAQTPAAQSGQTQGTTQTQPTTQQPPTTPPQGTTTNPPGTVGTSGTQIQQPVPGTQGQTPTANQPLTITGCIAPGTGASAGGYLLNNVTGGAENSPTSYTLVGGDRTAMASYGSSTRVEVIGTPAVQQSGASGASGATGATGAVGTSGSTAAGAGVSPATPATPASPRPTSPTDSSTSATGAPSAGASATGSTLTPGVTPPPPSFTVTSIRRIPGSCGGGL